MNSRLLMCLGAMLPLFAAPVVAQDDIWLNPDPAYNMTPPELFSGAYAGVAVGLQVNNFLNFYAAGTNYRVPGGVFAGYNYQFTPSLLAGVEVQLDGTYDPWSGTNVTGYNLFGLTRFGFLTSPDFMVYQTAGLGVIDGNAAFGMGIGIEQAVTDNMSLRFESIAYGQIASLTTGTFYGGFTSMEIAAGAVWYLDGNPDRAGWHAGSGSDTPTDFVGPYAGFYAGGIINPNYSFFKGTPLKGWHLSQFTQGGLAGYNFDVGGPVRAGVEAQAGLHFDTSGDVNFEGQALARIGVVPIDGLMVYATGGGGMLNGYGAYTLGGGVEYALWGDSSLRLDVQALGANPPRHPRFAGFTASKWTIGSIWHMD